jgi:O-antigen/teichoic acid export membrane protein
MLVVGLAQAAVIARWLGPEGKGLLVLLLWAPGLVCDLFAGFRSAAAWSLGKERFAAARVVRGLAGLWLVASGVGMVATVLAFWAQDLPLPLVALIGGLLYIPAVVSVRYTLALGIGMRWMTLVNRSQLAFQGFTAAMVIVAIVALDAGPGGVVWAMVVGALFGLATTPSWVARIAPIGIRFDLEVLRVLVGKGAVFAVALAMCKLNYRADVLLVQWFMTEADVGLYAQGVGVIELTLQIPSALAAVIFSHSVAAGDAEAFRQRSRRIVWRAVPLLVAGALGVCAIAPWFVPLFFGEAFRASVPVIWALAPGIVAVGVFQLVISEFNGRGRPEVGLWAALVSLGLNLALNLWWIPLFGILGAAFASSVSYGVMALWMWIAQLRSATELEEPSIS